MLLPEAVVATAASKARLRARTLARLRTPPGQARNGAWAFVCKGEGGVFTFLRYGTKYLHLHVAGGVRYGEKDISSWYTGVLR
jgi:hypothetical protein